MFKVHHIGCLVADIEQAKLSYKNSLKFEIISDTCVIAAQKVKVCFISIGENIFLELIEPMEASSLEKMMNKGVSYYHIAYSVADIDSAIESLVEQNYFHINTFCSEAFKNNKCAFLYSPERHLIELVEEK